MSLIAIIISGIFATFLMSLFVLETEPSTSPFREHEDAVGKFLIHDMHLPLASSIIFHFLMGVFFAAAYYWIIYLMQTANQPVTFLSIAGTGAIIGLIHGFIVSFVSYLGLSEYHPIRFYRKFTFQAAMIHLLAHLIFGIVVGVGFAMLKVTKNFEMYAVVGALILLLTILFLPRREKIYLRSRLKTIFSKH